MIVRSRCVFLNDQHIRYVWTVVYMIRFLQYLCPILDIPEISRANRNPTCFEQTFQKRAIHICALKDKTQSTFANNAVKASTVEWPLRGGGGNNHSLLH